VTGPYLHSTACPLTVVSLSALLPDPHDRPYPDTDARPDSGKSAAESRTQGLALAYLAAVSPRSLRHLPGRRRSPRLASPPGTLPW
jgi:hypothetical protein